jgi:hypothetical protein
MILTKDHTESLFEEFIELFFLICKRFDGAIFLLTDFSYPVSFLSNPKKWRAYEVRW